MKLIEVKLHNSYFPWLEELLNGIDYESHDAKLRCALMYGLKELAKDRDLAKQCLISDTITALEDMK